MKALLIDGDPAAVAVVRAAVVRLYPDADIERVSSARIARRRLQPGGEFDVVLLGSSLGDGAPLSLLADLRAGGLRTPILLLAGSQRKLDVLQALDFGAAGVVLRTAGAATVAEALRAVLDGKVHVPPTIIDHAAPVLTPLAMDGPASAGDGYADHGPPSASTPHSLAHLGLTPRQTDVVALLLEGLSNKEIARDLNISVETVKEHVAAVLRTLNVTSRARAVMAVKWHHGVLDDWRRARQSSALPKRQS